MIPFPLCQVPFSDSIVPLKDLDVVQVMSNMRDHFYEEWVYSDEATQWAKFAQTVMQHKDQVDPLVYDYIKYYSEHCRWLKIALALPPATSEFKATCDYREVQRAYYRFKNTKLKPYVLFGNKKIYMWKMPFYFMGKTFFLEIEDNFHMVQTLKNYKGLQTPYLREEYYKEEYDHLHIVFPTDYWYAPHLKEVKITPQGEVNINLDGDKELGCYIYDSLRPDWVDSEVYYEVIG